jgi:hypothetical protein
MLRLPHTPMRSLHLLFSAAVFLPLLATAALTTTVLPDPYPNEAPFDTTRTFNVERNTARRTPSAILNVYDVENDPLSIASFTQPSNGSAVANGDGTFTYTPAKDFTGNDSFTVSVSDGRGGASTTTMQARVIAPQINALATRFTNFASVQAAGADISLGASVSTSVRAIDLDRDGKLDLVVGAQGGVLLYRNEGTATKPVFSAPVAVQANGKNITAGTESVGVAWVDFDGDGVPDLAVFNGVARTITFYRTTTKTGPIALAEGVLAQTSAGTTFVAASDEVPLDIADWNGDGKPDVITGRFSGNMQVAYGISSTAAQVRFGTATTLLDSKGMTISGSYNLAPRVVDLSRDGVPDLLVGYNWGTIEYYKNTGSAVAPVLQVSGSLAFSLSNNTKPNLHAMANGPYSYDLADLNGDGVLDLIIGGWRGGTIYIGMGVTSVTDLDSIVATVAAHPSDLGIYLKSDAAAKAAMKNWLGTVYDFVTEQATPSQLDFALNTIKSLITTYPQYFKAQTLDNTKNPNIASLASMVHLMLLMGKYHDPAHRTDTANTVGMVDAYRTLCEEMGLLYMDNFTKKDLAEAIRQWVRWMPRDVYPGTGITVKDLLGSDNWDYNVRGHLKNTWTGSATTKGEIGFNDDLKAVIGARVSANGIMSMVQHEATHDLDAYVRGKLPPDFNRRWGQILVRACGRDASGENFMKSDPVTGWYSMSLTQNYWMSKGWWNGTDDWNITRRNFYTKGPGAFWNTYGFMRGDIEWFTINPQESLATQGNQFWNSGEGRIQAALDRWRRGYDTNITEVLHFMDIQSKGRNKMKLWENNDANDQVISYAQLYRNGQGYINGVDVNGRSYRFVVDNTGVVTAALPPDIAFVTPLRQQLSIPSGVGLWLNATATPLNGVPVVMTVWSLVSGSGTATFDNANVPTTGVKFSSPGEYVLRFTADDGKFAGSKDITVQVGSLHTPKWTGCMSGGPDAGAGYTLAAGVYTIADSGSSGVSYRGTTDQFYFISREFVGDGTLTARVVSVQAVTDWDSQGGVMFRESKAAGSRHVFCGIDPRGVGHFMRRGDATNSTPIFNNFNASKTRWVRLVRLGDTYTAYSAQDNSGAPGTWNLEGTITTKMSGIIEAGIVGTSGDLLRNGSIVIDNVTLTPVAVNDGPAVNAGGDRSVPPSTTLTGAALDDGFVSTPVLSWEQRSGPGTVTFGLSTGVNTPATFSNTGVYGLRLYADDGAVKTYDQSTVTVTIISNWDTWRATNFSAAERSNAAISGPTADPDFDGLANFLEYTTGLNPRATIASPLTVTAVQGGLKLRFTRNLAATDASLVLKSSSTLAAGTWKPVPQSEETMSEVNGIRTVEVTVPLREASMFFRLEATKP